MTDQVDIKTKKRDELAVDRSILKCSNLSKYYLQGDSRLKVLESIFFDVKQAEKVAIVGASGSGKSTLLNLLAGLDAPSSGTVSLVDKDLSTLTDNDLSQLRNKHLGFVYQFHHLLAEFSALENVMFPLLIGKVPRNVARSEAAAVLASVGLSDRLHHRPAELSGGERQRVAIARALSNQPSCILMDEPTGNLDKQASSDIQQLIQLVTDQQKTSFIIVTHDERVTQDLDKVYQLDAGNLVQV
ncbi:MAG: lipoprotein-releasing system ATP-binding protein LolD [Cellvibrionales bacterium]|nr:lipoprotein-releasing system ATP-binding protein LolD [Cellvibrionales bacterium]|tara:strand:+ start:25200 stop:25928 length:729 start_codon:yes stop_codon:yes gene_type:complete